MTDITLTHGSHPDLADGVCLLELVSHIAGEAFSDRPRCVPSVLALYGRELNDTILPLRQDLEPQLRALAPLLVGTADRPDLDQRAGLLAADWLTRVCAPRWLRLAGLVHEAAGLERWDKVTTWAGMPRDELREAHNHAYAAEAEARGRARMSARTLDGMSTGSVAAPAGYAAREAAWLSAAGDAAWIAYDAVEAIQAASQAAVQAARAAAADAVAAEVVAQAAFAPTVRALQDSAMELYTAMIAVYHVGEDEDERV